MALTEELIERIEVLEEGQIQIKTVSRILRDGVEIARTTHRAAVAPGQDVSARSARVKAVAQAVWTPDVVSTFAATMAAREGKPAQAPVQPQGGKP